MSEPRLEAAGEGRLRVSGELTFATVPGLFAQSAPLIATAQGPVDIDLSGVLHCDSAGIALLLEWTRAVQGRGPLKLSNLSEQMRQLARVVGLESILPIV